MELIHNRIVNNFKRFETNRPRVERAYKTIREGEYEREEDKDYDIELINEEQETINEIYNLIYDLPIEERKKYKELIPTEWIK